MTKLESGAIVPNAALHDLRRDRRQRACGGRAKFSRSIGSRLSLPRTCRWWRFDAVLFEQVLFNLLDNAAKYAPAGTTIRIQSWRDRGLRWPPDSGRRRRHSARRSGAHLRQVLSGAEGRPRAGRHRAWVSRFRAVSSRPCTAPSSRRTATDRTGAVFTITLPVPAETATVGHRRMTAAPLKVLVIDDEPPIRKLLRMGLTTQGYQILEAPNGKTALELLSQKPDLVILDLGLPDIQGHELLRMIRARNESVPIVVLSSRGDEAGKVQALDFGADDYVTKPFGMDELLARMRAALRHQLQVHGERPVFRVGDLSVDLVRRIVKVRRQGREAFAQGIRPAARAGAARRQGADPQIPARRAVGRSDGRPISARLCAAAPAEDRRPTPSGRNTSSRKPGSATVDCGTCPTEIRWTAGDAAMEIREFLVARQCPG